MREAIEKDNGWHFENHPLSFYFLLKNYTYTSRCWLTLGTSWKHVACIKQLDILFFQSKEMDNFLILHLHSLHGCKFTNTNIFFIQFEGRYVGRLGAFKVHQAIWQIELLV
jgi:hypothetical protein